MSAILDWVSKYIVVVAIVILLIIVTFLLLIFMPKPKCYFDVSEICKELLLLSKDEYFKKIQEEVEKKCIDMGDLEDQKNPVKSKIVYKNNQVCETVNDIPETYELLRTVPNIRQISIIVINKKAELPKCKGSESAQFSNQTLRCILPIKISAAKRCGIWVDGETKFFSEGEWIMYDNSREHSVHNKHKRLPVYLLVVDIDRPNHIPIGIAVDDNKQLI